MIVAIVICAVVLCCVAVAVLVSDPLADASRNLADRTKEVTAQVDTLVSELQRQLAEVTADRDSWRQRAAVAIRVAAAEHGALVGSRERIEQVVREEIADAGKRVRLGWGGEGDAQVARSVANRLRNPAPGGER